VSRAVVDPLPPGDPHPGASTLSMNLRKMLETLRAFRAGAPLGDVAVLKFDALSAPPMWLTAKLEPLRGYAPAQDLTLLRALAPGTLGREYAGFLDANGITPLVVSPHVKERFHDNPYVLRYATTHDLHHVLTGFDTGLAGEAGVFAFTIAQGSAPAGRGMLQLVRIVYALFSPTQARRVWHNIRIGLALGAAAKLVIAEPIEAWFEEPLVEVRRKLGLGDPQRAGVLPSGKSPLASLVYGPRKPTLPPARGHA
jgi:ubiquinone biosynthesis protein COQ4